eukprot:CAMPEP_0113305758 /NCGR_PEP_ID=MMETSP0010_2-20120614/5265_1 /TAXON_ID=216773 ORGANISM="Corethron hystrix, Strain 308" /NCGR_SAMPLE_ID=MMETSP0010_2 /ASSEMBLY_ACC=CAM_ASM_000155 /LENGTH=72 /DNA_ID=CAMNT_0000160257 /DNA_START=100 /DNA_END=319 /DNA_ORIENTATION=+ /assembly_acc=CAM_ASM_000155
MIKRVILAFALFAASSEAFAPTSPSFGIRSSALFAEDTDFKSEIEKLQKEAQERMDAKIEELQKKLDAETAE